MPYFLPSDTCYGLACATTNITAYYQLFRLKQRPNTKPLSVMILDYDFLRKNTLLNEQQIQFLKNYSQPWTVLTKLANNSSFQLPTEIAADYPKIAFRVANLPTQKKLLQAVGPIFLTSANLSWQPEIYHPDEIKTVFANDLDKIKIYEGECGQQPPSDIFEFVGVGEEVTYLRKN